MTPLGSAEETPVPSLVLFGVCSWTGGGKREARIVEALGGFGSSSVAPDTDVVLTKSEPTEDQRSTVGSAPHFCEVPRLYGVGCTPAEPTLYIRHASGATMGCQEGFGRRLPQSDGGLPTDAPPPGEGVGDEDATPWGSRNGTPKRLGFSPPTMAPGPVRRFFEKSCKKKAPVGCLDPLEPWRDGRGDYASKVTEAMRSTGMRVFVVENRTNFMKSFDFVVGTIPNSAS